MTSAFTGIAVLPKLMKPSERRDLQKLRLISGLKNSREITNLYITEDAVYFPTLHRALSLLWIHEAIGR